MAGHIKRVRDEVLLVAVVTAFEASLILAPAVAVAFVGLLDSLCISSAALADASVKSGFACGCCSALSVSSAAGSFALVKGAFCLCLHRITLTLAGIKLSCTINLLSTRRWLGNRLGNAEESNERNDGE